MSNNIQNIVIKNNSDISFIQQNIITLNNNLEILESKLKYLEKISNPIFEVYYSLQQTTAYDFNLNYLKFNIDINNIDKCNITISSLTFDYPNSLFNILYKSFEPFKEEKNLIFLNLQNKSNLNEYIYFTIELMGTKLYIAKKITKPYELLFRSLADPDLIKNPLFISTENKPSFIDLELSNDIDFKFNIYKEPSNMMTLIKNDFIYSKITENLQSNNSDTESKFGLYKMSINNKETQNVLFKLPIDEDISSKILRAYPHPSLENYLILLIDNKDNTISVVIYDEVNNNYTKIVEKINGTGGYISNVENDKNSVYLSISDSLFQFFENIPYDPNIPDNFSMSNVYILNLNNYKLEKIYQYIVNPLSVFESFKNVTNVVTYNNNLYIAYWGEPDGITIIDSKTYEFKDEIILTVPNLPNIFLWGVTPEVYYINEIPYIIIALRIGFGFLNLLDHSFRFNNSLGVPYDLTAYIRSPFVYNDKLHFYLSDKYCTADINILFNSAINVELPLNENIL